MEQFARVRWLRTLAVVTIALTLAGAYSLLVAALGMEGAAFSVSVLSYLIVLSGLLSLFCIYKADRGNGGSSS